MAASNYLENKIYDHVLRGIVFTPPSVLYVSLWNTDPTDAGSGNELAVADGYIRQLITFGAPTNGSGSNSNFPTFLNTGGAWLSSGFFGVHDAQSGGNILYHNALVDVETVGAGETWQFAAGSLVLTHS